ncbi:DUF3298 and DUF4163 domain-containing protein [Pedobacter montanisoli]|uniref:DUF3298 and DUF4163 domain-containing protein n=1 Tax=Pedobacter montanisoli TaxID=2923277 RepID=A0ABS9ZZ79_9SPHI|nr:DUF3298 and DUF4163 domain-containing protein [Pedobacter montanisoli]MCJ0743612.1 DUF3298 and DUF4163 domain-containing protein [Pedobacter montanisoli]
MKNISLKTTLFFLFIALSFFACRNEEKKGKDLTGTDTLTYKTEHIQVLSSYIPKPQDGITDITKATISYPVFQNKALNDYLLKQVFSFFSQEEPPTSYQDVANSFVKGYDEFATENKDYTHSWYLDINIKPISQFKDYIALAYTHSDYTGGAHGSHNIIYINFDPVQNKPLTLDNLIENGSSIKLTALGEQIFRKDEKLSATEPLTEKYFFENGKFILPLNFYIGKNGLVFLYNAYEIKPYVDGTTELVIPFDQLKGILKPQYLTAKN